MDERQSLARRLIRISLYISGSIFAFFCIYTLYIYVSLQQIEDPKKCFTTKMYKVKLCSSNPDYVRYKQVPEHFIRALIQSEDSTFFSHKGLDWFEIKESFRRNIKERRFARGGSTITQQLAKNLYLTKEKSISRKVKEFFLAKQIEDYLSKAQILEKYVNVVEFGKGIYGISRASEHYFHKSAESLNVLESVYLVSLLPSPVRYSKSFKEKKLSKINLSRMKIILGRLYRTKRISDEVFVFCETLLDNYDWPFPHYSNPFQESFENIELELGQELEAIDTDEFIEASEIIEEDEEGQEPKEFNYQKDENFEKEVKQAVEEQTPDSEKENFEPLEE